MSARLRTSVGEGKSAPVEGAHSRTSSSTSTRSTRARRRECLGLKQRLPQARTAYLLSTAMKRPRAPRHGLTLLRPLAHHQVNFFLLPWELKLWLRADLLLKPMRTGKRSPLVPLEESRLELLTRYMRVAKQTKFSCPQAKTIYIIKKREYARKLRKEGLAEDITLACWVERIARDGAQLIELEEKIRTRESHRLGLGLDRPLERPLDRPRLIIILGLKRELRELTEDFENLVFLKRYQAGEFLDSTVMDRWRQAVRHRLQARRLTRKPCTTKKPTKEA